MGDIGNLHSHFYTFTVCENAVFFAAVVICCAMLALWQKWRGNASKLREVAKIASSSHLQKM